jgi:ribosome-binding protein aMBF1 (putative translation factor)
MSKANRGTGVRKTLTLSRKECPLCGRTGIKLLYQVNQGEEQINVCKACNARENKKNK